MPDDANPFAGIDPQDRGTEPQSAPTPQGGGPDNDPFAGIGPTVGESSFLGAAKRSAVRSVLPAAGGLIAAGAGAEIGAAVGALGGPLAPLTVPAGALAGGIAGSILGANAVSHAQDWILSQLPDSWRGDRQRQLDERTQPIGSFIGGLVPYVLTMRPGPIGGAAAKLPENATALQRIMTNPYTARVFGGGLMGGMEFGQELAADQKPDWRNIAISTGFGMIFNKPTRLGEAVEELGARPVRSAVVGAVKRGVGELPPVPNPTIAQVNDAKVMGPGVTEQVFRGTEQIDPSAGMVAAEAARTEDTLIRNVEPPKPDINETARKIEPETFADWDELAVQRDTFRDQLAEMHAPSDEAVSSLEAERAQLETERGLLTATGKDRLRIANRLAEIDEQHGAMTERRAALEAGEPVSDTPEMAIVRQRLVRVDEQMRDLGPQVSAAYRRAEEMQGLPAEAQPEPVVAQQETQAPQQIAQPEPAQPTAFATSPEHFNAIVQDVTDKLVKAGRPQDEAEATAKVYATMIAARAERLGGTKGTALDLYNSEGLEIVGKEAGGPKGLAQGALNGAKTVMTIFRKANASTAIHELGHKAIDDLLKDALGSDAPQQLKDDATAVRNWLGSEGGELTTAQEERGARGLERYLMEGVAPSKALARVFEQFKQWMAAIYKTVAGIKYQNGQYALSDDIRRVFDRMLTTSERAVIAPERELPKSLADVHEADANNIEPHEAEAAADRISAEAAALVKSQPPEVQNEFVNTHPKPEAEPGGQTAGGADEGAEPHGAEPQSGPVAPDRSAGENAGKVGKGGSGAETEGAAVRTAERPDTGLGATGIAGTGEAGRQSPGPNTPFPRDETRLVDKAGNIRLENLDVPENVADAIRQAADENDDFIGDRRGIITDGQVQDLADALGMDPDKLNRRKLGQAFNAEQVWAARKLLIQSATVVRDAMRKAAQSDDVQSLIAYAEAKDRHRMIQGQVSGITAEAGRALRAFRAMEGQAGAEQIGDFVQSATGKTLYQLREEAKLGATLDTPQEVSKFVQDSQKRTFGRMLLEYWINGLISGPATHTTYMAGNTLLALESAGPERAAAALIGKVRSALGREGETVQMGEVGAGLKGAVKGLPGAISAAAQALRTGVTTLLPGEEARKALPFQPGTEIAVPGRMSDTATMRDAMADTFGVLRGLRDAFVATGELLKGGDPDAPFIGAKYSSLGSIPDIAVKGVTVLPVGNVIRVPGRAIAAIHSFYRAVNYSIEKGALAYRNASNEMDVRENLGRPMSQVEFDTMVGKGWTDPTEDVMEQAAGTATQLTLMGHGSKFVQALSKLTNTEILGFPVLKFIDPFVHIAGNVIDQSIVQRTPIGILAPEIRADLMGKNGTIAQDTAMAKMLVGTGLAITFGGLASQGLMSGSEPSDYKEAAIWRLAGNQAHSVRVGDIWYDVHRLGPLGMLMGIAADMYQVGHVATQEDMSKAGATLVHAITQNVLDESFMRGPSDLIRALEDSDRYGDQYVRNFLASFVPFSVGMAQMARASDPYTRQARTIMDAIKAKIPGISEELLPRRDIWGDPIPNKEVLGGPGLSAIYEQAISKDPVNLALLQLSIFPAQPERRIRNIKLTDQEYDDYCRIAGRMTKMRLDAFVHSPDWAVWPDHVKRDVIQSELKADREAAAGIVMGKYPHIVRDAWAAKQAKQQN